MFDRSPNKDIVGSCLKVFNMGRGFQIPNSWDDRIKAKIKTQKFPRASNKTYFTTKDMVYFILNILRLE